jgi:hypothetical protein
VERATAFHSEFRSARRNQLAVRSSATDSSATSGTRDVIDSSRTGPTGLFTP